MSKILIDGVYDCSELLSLYHESLILWVDGEMTITSHGVVHAVG